MHNVARHPGGFIKPYITIAIMAREGKPKRKTVVVERGLERRKREGRTPAGFARVSDIIAEGDIPLRDAPQIVPL